MGMKTPFIRAFDSELQDKLTNSHLYKSLLLKDILPIDKAKLKKEKEDNNKRMTKLSHHRIFPAIRNRRIDFYFCGNKLFSFDKKGYSTHIKYASVLLSEKEYVSESVYKTLQKPSSFLEGYEQIKENCSLYAGIESAQLVDLLDRFSFLNYSEGATGVFVLDIEVQFGQKTDHQTQLQTSKKRQHQDRIDLLLYYPQKQRLKFVEAKHFSNLDIKSRKKENLKVRKQIARYNRQIKLREPELISAYNGYIEVMNGIFQLNLPKVRNIDKSTGLIIYGFDYAQEIDFKESFMTDPIENGGELSKGRYGNLYNNIPVYMRGDATKLNAKIIWDKTPTPETILYP